MRYVVACVIGLVGCAAETEEPPKGPDIRYIPQGNGWGCWEDRVAQESTCTRPAACEPTRQAVAEEFNRIGANYSFTPCALYDNAACFTSRLAGKNEPSAWCTRFLTECEAIRKRVAANPEFRDVSERCGTYN
jgi:hypothetical protein